MKNVWCSQLNYALFRALRFGCQRDLEQLKGILSCSRPALIQSDICHRKLYKI